ncbi:sulfotransferase domain-containing protein [Haloferula chungangensis]|uniref:Sulfotransferase domain-containing protein n=1 Tax=Haloferula chungangensis TaxID=1048331 RepID=A0ABW2L935_9BACT
MKKLHLFAAKLNLSLRRCVGLCPSRFCCIRGFPKSGTNWVGNLLRLHPDVYVSGEWAFGGIAEALNERTKLYWTESHNPSLKGVFEREQRKLFKKHYLLQFALGGGAGCPKWICDQTPAPVYPEVIPGAPVIYVVRNIRDIAVSRAFHLLRHDGDWGIKEYPVMRELYQKYHGKLEMLEGHPQLLLSDFDWVEDTVRTWAERVRLDVSGNLEDSTYLTSDDRNDARLHIVKYEDLHADIEGARSKMYEFLELDPARAAELDTGKVKTTPGFKKENPNAFFRSGKVNGWKRYWNDDLEKIVQRVAGEVIREFYP